MQPTSVPAGAGKHWLITGVSSGLGRALAQSVLRRGDRVTGTVRTEAARTAFLRGASAAATARLLDVTDEAAVRATVAASEEETGPIDVVVNNAGYALVAGVEEASLDEIRAQFAVNVFGAVAVMQAALPFLRARRAGRIINISSVSGLVGWPALGIYSASKFALEGLSETLALEVAPQGIHLTLIEPGGLRTDFSGRSRVQSARRIAGYEATVGANRRILAEHAGREPGDPARVARAILAVVDAPNPPRRLLLGTDALGYVQRKLQQHAAEIDAGIALTMSTDFDER